jgi:hypothetical protein
MYFHTDDQRTISWLADVLATARDTGTRIRILTDGNGDLKIKRGGGMWSPPLRSTDDPFRDNSQQAAPAISTTPTIKGG